MKAPDKIYIHRKDNPLEITWSETEEKGCTNTEYIRKDALVEWLQQGFTWIKNPVISVQQIIDKLNSL